MANNFNARFMQGYNYPHISVLTVHTDSTGTQLLSYPSYDEISSLISRGIMPILIVLSETDTLFVGHLNCIYRDLEIHFSTGAHIYDLNGKELPTYYLIFRKGSAAPIIKINAS